MGKRAEKLYSIENIRKYIIDVDEAKSINKSSGELINCKCDNCGNVKEIRPRNLIRSGFNCYYCSKGISYPEKFILSYIKVLKLNFEYQVVFKNAKNLRFDFVDYENRIIIEAHGEQHYDEKCGWYERTHKSDIAKRQWCKKNGYNLIELDCRKSEFKFIQKSIEECELLPNIKKDTALKILDVISANEKYDINSIIDMYNKGNSTETISEKYKVDKNTISNILKRNNINMKKPGTHPRKEENKYNDVINLNKEGFTVIQICNELDISKGIVYNVLKKNGLKPNKRPINHFSTPDLCKKMFNY